MPSAPCPKCSHTNRFGLPWTHWFVAIVLFPIGLLVLLVQHKVACAECGNEYTSPAVRIS